MGAYEEAPFRGRSENRWYSVLRVGSYVPRNASGGKTQEGKNTLQATAGKLRIVARGEWPSWLEGISAREVVEKWREKSPLWLLEGLPNLPMAQLAVEIGARGPVETLRERDGVEGDVEKRIQRWGKRGVKWVVSVRLTSTGAKAEVWGWEGAK